jgi:hypothetical protein
MDMGHRHGQGQDKFDQTLQKNKSILSDEKIKKGLIHYAVLEKFILKH